MLRTTSPSAGGSAGRPLPGMYWRYAIGSQAMCVRRLCGSLQTGRIRQASGRLRHAGEQDGEQEAEQEAEQGVQELGNIDLHNKKHQRMLPKLLKHRGRKRERDRGDHQRRWTRGRGSHHGVVEPRGLPRDRPGLGAPLEAAAT